jgi:hypothetical protein
MLVQKSWEFAGMIMFLYVIQRESSLFLYQWKWMMDMLKFLLATGFSILACGVRAKEDYVILQMSTLMK